LTSSNDAIVIRGARTHNLKNISCEIPHGKLTVVSGVSGSGKSSLAFDTIYAEGQRRYVESLSAYARQFLERIEKPDVDEIDGLAPAIAIKQKNTTRNPRSTVATATEIYDYLRLLYARAGEVHCIYCDGLVKRDSMDEVADAVLALGDGTRLNALFPVRHEMQEAEPVKPAKRAGKPAAKASEKLAASTAVLEPMSEGLKSRLMELRGSGFNRLYQNGQIYEFSTPESLIDIDFTAPLFVLLDRIVISADNRARIVDAAEIAYREAGEVIFEEVPRDESPERKRHRFSGEYECKSCHRPGKEPEPRLFSFNNPFGACPRCQGFGNTVDYDLNLVIPDKGLSLNDGAIDPWNRPKYRTWFTDLKKQASTLGIPMDVPWREMREGAREIVLRGAQKAPGAFEGVHGFFAQMEKKKYKLHVRVMLSKYRGYAECPECRGQRLRAEARAVRINGLNVCQAAALTIAKAKEFFAGLKLTPMQQEIAGPILEEVQQRLSFLDAVGLEYLTLDRLASTLSGGEAQRIQLATSLGSQLVGTLYVLDEPSIGLHTRDTARLIRILKKLRDLGNTIVVVEHDADVLRAADHLLDLGPGAGEFGGKLLAEGVLAEIEANPNSLTGKYLSGKISIPVPTRRRAPGREKLVLKGAEANNLHGLNVEIPLGMLVAITGVSGSGKSTLVHQVLYRAVAQALGQTDGGDPSGAFRSLTGVERLNDVILVDQTPIGRTPRSNPITYIKGFDLIRELFASQPDAKRLSLTPGHFSFNVPGGRCNTCEGDGTVTVEMQFLADVELPCEDCNGTRYQAKILEVQYKGKNIHEVLQMTVKEALRFFAGQTRLLEKLAVLDEIGLGYLRLGQSATTLSGGEAQRVKLAAHLSQVRAANASAKPSQASRVLYILDEPTTGLHFDDVSKLLTAFRKLIDGGGSLIVIEHNLDVIKSADWVIDLGPEGGEGGGHIVAEGTPEEVAATLHSHTGEWLAKVL
jgi:excinuclease ABC subunit A